MVEASALRLPKVHGGPPLIYAEAGDLVTQLHRPDRRQVVGVVGRPEDEGAIPRRRSGPTPDAVTGLAGGQDRKQSRRHRADDCAVAVRPVLGRLVDVDRHLLGKLIAQEVDDATIGVLLVAPFMVR